MRGRDFDEIRTGPAAAAPLDRCRPRAVRRAQRRPRGDARTSRRRWTARPATRSWTGCEAQLAEHGWGLWAVERLDTGELIGFTGLNPAVDLPPSPARRGGLAAGRRALGAGLRARRRPRAALEVAFDGLGLDEVVSFTTTRNANSRRVMTKLGLTHRPERDFDHPRTPGWAGAAARPLRDRRRTTWRERPERSAALGQRRALAARDGLLLAGRAQPAAVPRVVLRAAVQALDASRDGGLSEDRRLGHPSTLRAERLPSAA